MSHVHSSIAATLHHTSAHLITTHHQFQAFLNQVKHSNPLEQHSQQITFAQALAACLLHHSIQLHPIIPTLHQELAIIPTALCDPPITK